MLSVMLEFVFAIAVKTDSSLVHKSSAHLLPCPPALTRPTLAPWYHHHSSISPSSGVWAGGQMHYVEGT